MFTAVKISAALLAGFWRRENPEALLLCLLYAALQLLAYIGSPAVDMAGRDWYLWLCVMELAFIVMLTCFDTHNLKAWLLKCAALAVALDLAAWWEYPRASITIYTAYPYLMQALALVEVVGLLTVSATPYSARVKKLLKRFRDAEAKRSLTPVIKLLR